MKLQGKLYVAGHGGLVGSAIMRSLQRSDCENIVEKNTGIKK